MSRPKAKKPERQSSNVTIKFSERLSDLVEEKKKTGINQDKIASEIGISSASLSTYCSDFKTPSINALAKIALYFDVTADYLLGLSDDKRHDPVATDELGLTQEVVDRLILWKNGQHDSEDAINKDLYCLDLTNSLLSSQPFINALRDFFISIRLSSLMGTDPSNYDEMYDYWEKEQIRALRQIDILREEQKSSFLLEATIAAKSYLTAEDLSEFYLQQGLNRVRKTIEALVEEGGKKHGKGRK